MRCGGCPKATPIGRKELAFVDFRASAPYVPVTVPHAPSPAPRPDAPMSDQPGIPAITVFPPFNPAPRQPEPAREPIRDQAPPTAEPEATPEPERAAAQWDAA